MKAAVVGAGIYGCITAIDLAAAGHEVDLLEKHDDILMGATRANQGRLHRGYHYPRSQATALNAFTDADRFEARFGECLNRSNWHYYAVAASGSRTTPEDYVRHAELLGGEVVQPPPWLHGVAACVRVDEAYIDVDRLRERLRRDLAAAGVTTWASSPVGDPRALPRDLVVMATYARPWPWLGMRYEVCEVVLVDLGGRLAGQSVVVMDGDFVSLDPVPGTALHMLYDVRHSVHAESVTAVLSQHRRPEHLMPLLDRGVVATRHTRFEQMRESASRFVDLDEAVYMGSMFTVRAVAGDDATDGRPTLLQERDGVLWLMAGKLDGAVAAAARVVALAAERAAVPA